MSSINSRRRAGLALGLGTALIGLAPAGVRAEPAAISHVGIFTLLGNSVRVVGRDLRELKFADVGMDPLTIEAAQAVLQKSLPQAQLSSHLAPEQTQVNDQLEIGLAAGRRGELPAWIEQAAQAAAVSHVLLVNSSTGVMDFRTALTEVAGAGVVTGIGFYIDGSTRTRNVQTGISATGYLAPFVQLRVSLIEFASRRVVHSVTLSDGYIVGAPESEAPEPWRFLDRDQKAKALRNLLRTNVMRGVEAVLAHR
jgi:hypothetical protein